MRVLLFSFTFAGVRGRRGVTKLNYQLVDKELGAKYEVCGQCLWTYNVHIFIASQHRAG